MRRITPIELQEGLTEGSLHLLDVRTPEELEAAALPQSINIPLHELPARHAELPRDKPIAVLCHHGMRSQSGALFLDKQGFEGVMSVDGGIDAYSLNIDRQIPRY